MMKVQSLPHWVTPTRVGDTNPSDAIGPESNKHLSSYLNRSDVGALALNVVVDDDDIKALNLHTERDGNKCLDLKF